MFTGYVKKSKALKFLGEETHAVVESSDNIFDETAEWSLNLESFK